MILYIPVFLYRIELFLHWRSEPHRLFQRRVLNGDNKNQAQKLPIILTGPACAADYFIEIDAFIGATLGEKAQKLYTIIVDDPEFVAKTLKSKLDEVITYRKQTGDGYHFNWSLHIDEEFQHPFEPNHENMAKLNLNTAMETAPLAANLRKAFSGIVAGNVKSAGIKSIRQHGPFKISGQTEIMSLMDKLLKSFVKQQRMKLPGSKYIPCYEIVGEKT